MSNANIVRDSIAAAIGVLETQGIPYMVVGSFSSNQWGIPRSTKDIDLVLLTDAPIPLIHDAVRPVFKLDTQLSFEPLSGKTKFLFRSALTEFEIEIFIFSEDSFDQSRFARRTRRASDGIAFWVQTPEDVIVQKLRWSRPKDLADVVDVMTVRWGRLDWAYIERWCSAHGSSENLAKMRTEAEALQ